MKGLNITSYERQQYVGSRRWIKQKIGLKDFSIFQEDVLCIVDYHVI
jgi:hypothetical protein